MKTNTIFNVTLAALIIIAGLYFFTQGKASTPTTLGVPIMTSTTSAPTTTAPIQATATPQPTTTKKVATPSTPKKSETPPPTKNAELATPVVAQPAPLPHAVAITIKDYAFTPATLTIQKGTTVTWTNQDIAKHTVTGDQGGPSSAFFGQGQSYSYTFTTPGSYPYHCDPHPYMTATIIVTE